MLRLLRTIPFIILLVLVSPADRDIYSAEDTRGSAEDNLSPRYRIYSKNDILFCTGNDTAGRENNRAAELMLEGKFHDAALILENGIANAPLFFPFRYNLGFSYLYLNRLDASLMHFTKAQQLVPEYYRTYLQIGYIYGRWNRESEALRYFREALKRNSRELNIYILIGDLFFNRGQLSTAKKYYEAALSINHLFPNGLLGLAKIHFKNEEYVKAIVLIKSVDISGDYDHSLHYYYAESAFKTKDYQTAAEQYENLLKFKNDRFFLVNSVLLIRHKLELSRRFSER